MADYKNLFWYAGWCCYSVHTHH